MLSLSTIIRDRFRLDAVLHLGAGSCNDLADYVALHAGRVVLVEANPELAHDLKTKTRGIPQVEVISAAVCHVGDATLRVLNNSRESSLLEPARLTERFPNLRVMRRIPVPTISLEQLVERLAPVPLQRNLLVVELQGLELSILDSVPVQSLQSFSWIAVRTSAEALYEGGAKEAEVNAELTRLGFTAVTTTNSLSGLPFMMTLYFFDAPHTQLRALESLSNSERRRAERLQRDKAALESALARQAATNETQRSDIAAQKTLLDRELSNVEMQVNLIKKILPGDTASESSRSPRVEKNSWTSDEGNGAQASHEHSLAKAKGHWLEGEWDALAAMDVPALQETRERGRVAALIAGAHQQLGAHDKAGRCVALAVEWGYPREIVARVLIASVHNTLGRIATLIGNESSAARHFRESVSSFSDPHDMDLLAHARSVRETARIGLLPHAALLVERELTRVRQSLEHPEQEQAHLRVLESELRMLQYELSLALQRNQLSVATRSVDPGPATLEFNVLGLNHLHRLSPAQQGQDLWVLEQTAYKRGGFFVEFGAADGVLLSNTWLLEKVFSWRGICAEPNPRFHAQLRRSRSCMISDACIAGETGKEVEFVFADEYGGIADYAGSDMHAGKRAAYMEAGRSTRLKTISLHDFLKKHDAPREIDYLSIDTEGNEFEILAPFPFSEWTIKLLTVEHNFAPQRGQIRALLARNGYQRIERQWEDWYVLPGDNLASGPRPESRGEADE